MFTATSYKNDMHAYKKNILQNTIVIAGGIKERSILFLGIIWLDKICVVRGNKIHILIPFSLRKTLILKCNSWRCQLLSV